MNYQGKSELAVHITLNHEVASKEQYLKQLFELCKADPTIEIVPELYIIRDTLPISEAGKIDMVAMAKETDGFIQIDS